MKEKEKMKAITIKQPWASLIAHGIKDIENRTWKTNFRGTVLIHTASTPDKEKFNALTHFQKMEAAKSETFKPLYFDDLPKSAIIGKFDIVDCVINHSSIWADKSNPSHSGFFDISRNKPIYNWVLENTVLFPEPILGVKGKLSFWDYPNILAEPEEENGKLYCHCQIPVKEENQVWKMHGKYICKYCDGIWYK